MIGLNPGNVLRFTISYQRSYILLERIEEAKESQKFKKKDINSKKVRK